jgi:hypothetical protein
MTKNITSIKTLTIVLSTFAAVAHLLVAFLQKGPVAVPDVPAYLSVAQWLAGSRPVADLAFHPGFGLILAPAALLGLSGSALHTAALLVNGLIATASIGLSVCLARRLGASYEISLGVAVFTAICPFFAASSQIAWPETLFGFVLVALALILTSKSEARLLAAGFISSFFIVFHPRAIVLSLALFVVATLSGSVKKAVIGLTFGFCCAALTLELTHTWPIMRAQAAQTVGTEPGIFAVLSGQILAIAGASFGLALIALIGGVHEIRSCRDSKQISKNFILTSSVLMSGLGAWVLAGSDRSDTLMYGRYMDPWLVPLTILGLIFVFGESVNRRKIICAGLLSVAICLLTVLNSADEVSVPGRRIMTVSLGKFWSVANGNLIPTALAVASLTVVAIFVFTLRSRIGIIGLLCFAFLASVSTLVSNQQHFYRVGQVAQGQVTVASLLPNDAQCLMYDIETIRSYAPWLYRLQNPELRHQILTGSPDEKKCGSYVIAGKEIAEKCDDVELMAMEPSAKWGLWRYTTIACD